MIETMRGHTLGRLITNSCTIPKTGMLGLVMGCGYERLFRAPAERHMENIRKIGDHVEKGEVVVTVGVEEICAQISSMLRGLIHPGVRVTKGLKVGDVDPHYAYEHCFMITDKALTVAGGAPEATLSFDCH